MMLITILKGLRQTPSAPVRATRPDRSRISVVDLSGPLPEERRPAPEIHPYRESLLVAASLSPMTYRRDATEMSKLPRELDPFESDFPWIGWTEPKHESIVRSEVRSPSFDRDLQRVLSMFDN